MTELIIAEVGNPDVTDDASRRPLVGGIEAGGRKFVCAIGRGPDDVWANTRIPTTRPDETLANVLDFFETHGRHTPVTAFGIASFGPLDLRRGSRTYGWITTTPKPGWAQTDLIGPLRQRFRVPVVIDTDVNGAALAEHRWGAARGADVLVYLTVGTGIGGGLLVSGQPLHGLIHPEMGHMRLPRSPDDRSAGVCPWHGDCLEGLASGPAIAARWEQSPETLAPEHPAWELEAHYLALGLVNVVTVVSPARIVLGGGVMRQTHLYQRVRTKLLDLLAGYVRAPELLEGIDHYVVAPGLGEGAGVLGALALAQDALDAGDGRNS